MVMQILELIKEGLTIEQIQEKLNISHKMVYYYINLLEQKGLLIGRKYYYNGDISYYLSHDFISDKTILLTRHADTNLRFLLIADLHLASSEEDLVLLNEVYNFCIKENIHVIFNMGDFIDGFVGSIPKKFNSSWEQIDYAMKNHPYDDHILNFLVLGNHDYSALKVDGVLLDRLLTKKRHDIKVVGYGEGKIFIKNDYLILRHSLKNGRCVTNYNNTLIINGHSHRMKTILDSNNYILYIPTISHILNENTLPGIVIMNLKTLNGYFQEVIVESFNYVNSRFYKTNESKIYLGEGKDFTKSEINNEENYKVLRKQ